MLDPVARGSGVALWRQIAEDLQADILSARLAPGERLPTEAELASRYDVNRHTLRRALAELSRKGLIEARPRLGTFVAGSRLAYPISSSTRFSEIVAGAGLEPAGRLLEASEVPASIELAKELAVAAGAPLVRLETLRIANRRPICVATSWFPATRFASIGRLFARKGSITAALKALGVRSYRRQVSRISARPANSDERRALDIEAGDTVLVVRGLNVDDAGIPIQVASTRFAAERVELVVES